MWLNGPEFLYHPIVNAFNESLNITVRPPEFQQELSSNTSTILADQNIPKIKLFDVITFNNLKNKANRQHLIRNKYLMSSKINEVKRLLFLDNQVAICNGNKYSDVTRNLNLKHDKSGVLSLHSRFKYMNIPFDMKTPAFIDTNHKLAE